MAFGKLDVEPADLTRVAGEYAGLQAAASAIGPQAADEVNRIIASHGPMGYPVAVGVVAGLARRQAQVDAKAADFGVYSQRFEEHAEAYRDGDHQGAQRFEALDFSEAAVPPDLDDDSGLPLPAEGIGDGLACWIGTADGPTGGCSANATHHMYVENGEWKLRDIKSGFVSEAPTPIWTELLPQAPRPGTDPYPADPDPTDAWEPGGRVQWLNPDGSLGGAIASGPQRPAGAPFQLLPPIPPGTDVPNFFSPPV